MNSLRGKGMSMDKAIHDEVWSEYWMSGGFAYLSDQDGTQRRLALEADLQERMRAVHKGHNRLLRKVAAAVDEAWPPDQYQEDGQSPGDIVRGFLVEPAEEANKDAATAAGEPRSLA
jgi:hypothetical protein